jgi:hypothetical protein
MTNPDWGDLERRPDTMRSTAEGHLWTAVILRAVTDARQPVPCNDALTWLFSDSARPLDFVWLCDVLDLPVETIRNSVRGHVSSGLDKEDMADLLRSMFSRVPAPFTVYQAQQHLKKLWFPTLVKHAIAKALRIGVLARDPEGHDYFRVTTKPKCKPLTHKKIASVTSVESPAQDPTTTASAQKLGKCSTPKTSGRTPHRQRTSTLTPGESPDS